VSRMPGHGCRSSPGALAVMAVVVVAVLAAWLVAVFLAAREPRHDGAAPTSPSETTGSAAAGTVHGQRASWRGSPSASWLNWDRVTVNRPKSALAADHPGQAPPFVRKENKIYPERAVVPRPAQCMESG
jgi:hypothetical protein